MKEILMSGTAKLGITLTDAQCGALIKYSRILTERNKSVNLTRITEPKEIATKHFLDSMTPILTGKIRGKVMDVGTGAGFPGLVLKCVMPEIQLTLLDSLNKRVTFLKDAAAEMGITEGIEFMHCRAEDAGHDSAYRERFDTVVSRAVANMRTLSEWCLPLTKVGGFFLALKGPLAAEELCGAEPAICALGGEVESVFECPIPRTNLNHKIIVVKKVRPTRAVFPRRGKKLSPAEFALGKNS